MKRFLLSSLFVGSTISSAHAVVVNLAPAGTESSSSTGFGGTPDLANDGNRDTVFANGSVFHSAGGTGPGEWYEVDLGSDHYLDRFQVFGRTDPRQGSVRDFTLEVFNNAGATVHTSTHLPSATTTDNPWGTAFPTGLAGQRVRLTLNNPNFSTVNFLTFSEFEVWGDSSPVPVNIAGTATVTAGAAGFGTTIADGIDGDLAASYNAVTGDRPIYHDATGAGQGFYRLEFPGITSFDEVQLFNRVEGPANFTTSEFRVSVLDDADGVITSQLVTSDDSDYDHSLDFGGVAGKTILIEETNPNEFLAFSEVRVFGTTIPEPSSLLLAALALPFTFRRRR